MFDVSIYREHNKILGELLVDSYFFDPLKYDYNFYLYNNGKKTAKAFYSKEMKVSFDLKDMTGVFHIRAFIRDIQQGDKRSFYSKKILVNN